MDAGARQAIEAGDETAQLARKKVILGKARRVRHLLSQADRARDRRSWDEAAAFYSAAIAAGPVRVGIWIQYGHMLKEAGRFVEAETAYRRAAEFDPAGGDAWLHLGHVLKRQERIPDAITAYADALRVDPALESARAELMHLGARDALPEFGAAGLRRARQMAEANRSAEILEASLLRLATEMPRPVVDYQAFCADYPIEPPPVIVDDLIDFVVDARFATPGQLRVTLLSLIEQTTRDWGAIVMAPTMLDHPVASLAAADSRFRFVDAWPQDSGEGRPFSLFVDAGTVLDRQAARWFGYVADRHAPAAAYADHDAICPHWRFAGRRGAPCFFPMFDRFFLAACDEPPLIALVRRSLFESGPADGQGADAFRRATLLAAGELGPVVHVPRVLSSRSILPQTVFEGADDLPSVPVEAPAIAATGKSRRQMTVIIPTRDLGDMLARCVDSLRDKADDASRLDIVIVDNRSREPETAALIERLERQGVARRLFFDEPFNWSRANNLAVAASAGEHLCFVNNDTEMLTQGWDRIVDDALQDLTVGALGARLFYPDGSMQHAGVLFGLGQGSPIHEGVGASSEDGGPLNRWRVRRQVPAATGAFLCCSREAFDSVGGFDELRLPIGFNDIDFCLRLRARGLALIYEPAIEMIHLESKTRGHNRTVTAREWDHAELESFHARWGEQMFVDPGYNPHWSPVGKPFDGLREPGRALVKAYIDRSAQPNPWRVAQ
jgi:GT2 family glycosyltransferase/Tfp pilus assembly protein PilF